MSHISYSINRLIIENSELTIQNKDTKWCIYIKFDYILGKAMTIINHFFSYKKGCQYFIYSYICKDKIEYFQAIFCLYSFNSTTFFSFCFSFFFTSSFYYNYFHAYLAICCVTTVVFGILLRYAKKERKKCICNLLLTFFFFSIHYDCFRIFLFLLFYIFS